MLIGHKIAGVVTLKLVMDAYVVKIMCPIPVKLLNNFGFKTGFHGKNLVLSGFFNTMVWFFNLQKTWQHWGRKRNDRAEWRLNLSCPNLIEPS